MSRTSPNRKALKELADLNVDAPFLQKYGNQVFVYDGEVTDEYKALCEKLNATANDAIAELQAILQEVPDVNSK